MSDTFFDTFDDLFDSLYGRLLYPDESSRLAINPGAVAGTKMSNVAGTQLVVYSNEEATVRADIRLDDDRLSVITDSIVTVEADSTLPQFFGPEGARVLWTKPLGSSIISPLYPLSHGRIDTLEDLMRMVSVVVDHGTNALFARPPVGVVIWYGSVAPLNRTGIDVWIDTSS